MGFAAHGAELRGFAAKNSQTVAETVKSSAAKLPHACVEWFMPRQPLVYVTKSLKKGAKESSLRSRRLRSIDHIQGVQCLTILVNSRLWRRRRTSWSPAMAMRRREFG